MILITGGSGFIGTNLIEHLLKTGLKNIISVDIRLPKISSHTKYFKKIDIFNFEELHMIFKTYEITSIIHLAARTDIKGKSSNDYIVNTEGTRNIAKLSLDFNIKRVLYTSSMLVNLPGKHSFETFNPYPNEYAKSKVEGEIIIREIYKDKLDIEYIILRPTSIWGPYMGDHYLDFFNKIKAGKYFHIKNIDPLKSYGYVGNIVLQICYLIDSDNKLQGDNIFYLRDPWDYSIRSWSNLIAGQLNVNIKTLPLIIFYLAALVGEVLNLFNIKFPLNFYRLNNLTNKNVVPLNNKLVNLKYTNLPSAVTITLNQIYE